MTSRVFVSHATKDSDIAGLFVESLEHHDVHCWIAPRDLPAGSEWAAGIVDGLVESDIMLVLVTRWALQSQHVGREVGIAARRRLPIVPVLLGDVELTGTLAYYLDSVHHEELQDTPTLFQVQDLANRIVNVIAGRRSLLEERLVAPKTARRPPPAPRDDPYLGRINRETPGCIVLLVDCSNSMHHRLGGGDEQRHAVVARSINDLLHQLAFFAEGDEGVLHYFDVAVLGYGLGEDGVEVRSLLNLKSDGLASISDVYAVHDEDIETIQVRSPSGRLTEHRKRRDIWVRPTANRHGQTVARRAFLAAQQLVEGWAETHPKSFPPIVINITDGGYSRDEDPAQVVRGIQELATRAGNALVFNCHLADRRAHESKAEAAVFPNDDDAQGYARAMRRLFDQSSPLPSSMLVRAREMNHEVKDGARGYVYNADAESLVAFLDVGTLGAGGGR